MSDNNCEQGTSHKSTRPLFKGHCSEQGTRQQIKNNIANKGHHGKQGYTTGLELDFSLD